MTEQRSARLPSVDRLLRQPAGADLVSRFGHAATVDALRSVLAGARDDMRAGTGSDLTAQAAIAGAAQMLEQRFTPHLRPMLNLTGTVLHTNMGRAILPRSAVDHVAMAMRSSCNLEYDIASGERGERDKLIEGLLCELTGAEAAIAVNNNAAAVLLVLAALAQDGEVILSRGELIEIGGSFRIPDVMRSAGVRLVEVGTTNRTHPADYERAVGPDTRALMKVHASNYAITGFVASVAEAELAEIAHARDLPLIVDLGAGSLIDLAAHGLPREPVVCDVLAGGADVVTFSGDKLLGGPQAGLIAGRRDLIERIRRHPLKRALRLSKIVLAALEACLLEYRQPDRLVENLPTLRLLTRPVAELEAMAARLLPDVSVMIGPTWRVEISPNHGQVGSGSLPSERIASVALTFAPAAGKPGRRLEAMAARLRALPVPVIGRIAEDRLWLDLRCLEDEALLLAQLRQLAPEQSDD